MRKAKSIFQGKNEPVWVRPIVKSCFTELLFKISSIKEHFSAKRA